MSSPHLATMATSEVGGEGEGDIVMVTVEEAENNTVSTEDSSAAMMVEFKHAHAGATQTDDNIESVYSANTLVEKMANSGDVTEVKVMEEVEEEVEDGDGSSLGYPITCGDNKATLIWKKFVCPGINVPCVKFNTGLISPKEFVNMAGKSTLKDWKRAIRMRGVMLRKVMDSGELDFYQHDKVCTSTCRSTKFDILINNVRLPIIGTQGEYSMAGTPSDVNGAQVCGGAEEAAKDASELVSTPSTSFLPSTPCTDSARAKDASELPGDKDEVFTLWKGISDVGLLGEVVNEVQQEIQDTLKALRQRIQTSPLQMSDAATLNGVVQHFGLMDNVKKILGNHKSQMGRYRDQYTRDLAELERQCDDQRRRSIEQKQRQQLTTLSPSAIAITPPPAKRPRTQRASASVATISGLTTIPMAKLPTLTTIPMSGVGGKNQPAFGAGTTTATYSTMLGGSPGTPGALTVIGSQAIISTASGLKMLSPVQFVSAQGGDVGGGIVSAAGLGAMLQGAQVVSGPGTVVTLQHVPVSEATVATMVSAAAASSAVPGALSVPPAAPATVPMEGEQAVSDAGESVAP